MDGKLPEEFAPTGPKLSRFPIRPAPPIRPHLFADEARFALRLSLLVGGSEFLAWFWLIFHPGPRVEILTFAALRCLKPLWAWLGTRVSRLGVAVSLLASAALAIGASAWFVWTPRLFVIAFVAAALPAVGDLCATCVGDSVTVERRAAAYAWLDMAQGVGALCGILAAPMATVHEWPSTMARVFAASAVGIAIASIGIPVLHDRGTPRSSWPLSAYSAVLRSPLALMLTTLGFVCGATAMWSTRGHVPPLWHGLPFLSLETVWGFPWWLRIAAPVAGMAVVARVETFVRNAIVLPRAAAGLAVFGIYLSLWPLSLFGMGMMLAAIPAAVARGAGEMERPIVSSLAWSTLTLGAAVGAVL